MYIADCIPALLSYWDKQLVCRFMNKPYCDLYKRNRQEVIDQVTLPVLIGMASFQRNKPFIDAVFTGQLQQFERITPMNGSLLRPSLVTYIPDKNNNEVVGFIELITDISHIRHQTEKKIADEKELLKAQISIQEKERERISQLLRNNVNQLLVHVNMMLAGNTKEPFSRDFTTNLIQTIHLAVKELNKLSNHLYPSDLNMLGLMPELDNLISGYIESPYKTHISIHCNNESIEEIGETDKLSVYRIIQDFIELILQSGEEKRIMIELSYRDFCLMIRIVCNNCIQRLDTNSNTFRDIRSRIDFFNGKLQEFHTQNELIYITHLVFSKENARS